jgi:TonB family protein
MSPVTLLFSSDQESSRRAIQALGELELAIEPCPDIFTAVEWLTSRTFDVIVADWDSGPEAAFLLKSARELKLNKAAFTLALSSGKSDLEAGEASPDLVLTKPLIPDQIKYALLTNDRFLGCMRAWIARGDFAQAPEAPSPAASATNFERRRPKLEQPSPIPMAAACPVEPSPALVFTHTETSAPLNLTFATLDRKLFRSLNQRSRDEHLSGKISKSKTSGRHKFLWGSTLTLVFACVGCIFGQPLRVQSVFASVATAYRQALELKSGKPPSPEDATASDLAALAKASQLRHPSLRVHALPAQPTLLTDQNPEPPAETLQADAHAGQDRLPPRVLIPESLTLPPPQASIRTVSLRRSPSLLSLVEPVSLPENLSQALLLDRVQPSYPEQALKAGLQGAVVLQAWIGKDGSIRDLKLVDGSLLLGKAAVKAVRQWRYKPYVRNGVAMEAETYVTVNFRLP